MKMTFPSFGPAQGQPGDSFVARAQSPSTVRRNIDRRGLVLFVACTSACVLLAAAALFHAWVRTQVTEEGYLLSQLHDQNTRLLDERARLRRESSDLMRPARIEQLARERLGMGPAKAERIVVLAERTMPAAARSSKTAVARR